MIEEVVIPAAGYGTRVAPASRAVPKELFPVPIVGWDGGTYLVPALQIIIENLFEAGVKKYFIVVNDYKKRVIEGYLEPDYRYLKTLYNSGKNTEANILNEFYRILESIEIHYVLQDEALGVGDAIHRCRELINRDFMIHMGDDFIINHENQYKLLVEYYSRLRPDALIMVQEVRDPRQYGIVEGRDRGNYIVVEKIIEKPDIVEPRYAILGVYCIKPMIFKIMDELSGKAGWELTDAVQEMIKRKYKVLAFKLKGSVRRIDIGRVDTYLDTLKKPIIMNLRIKREEV